MVNTSAQNSITIRYATSIQAKTTKRFSIRINKSFHFAYSIPRFYKLYGLICLYSPGNIPVEWSQGNYITYIQRVGGLFCLHELWLLSSSHERTLAGSYKYINISNKAHFLLSAQIVIKRTIKFYCIVIEYY